MTKDRGRKLRHCAADVFYYAHFMDSHGLLCIVLICHWQGPMGHSPITCMFLYLLQWTHFFGVDQPWCEVEGIMGNRGAPCYHNERRLAVGQGE